MKVHELGRRVIHESMQDNILDLAASVSYYFLFALFPALLFLSALLAELHMTGFIDNLISTLQMSLPREAGVMVSRQIHELLQNHPSGLISIGTILLLYAASEGFTGLMSAFNRAYEVPETRSWWKRVALAFGLTFSAGLLLALALAGLLFGEKLLFLVAGPFHFGPALEVVWPLLRWAAIFFFLWVAIVMIYRYLPNIRRNGIGTPVAALTSLILWVIASALLASYANHIATYSAIYGSLGAVIALMLWFYVLALALLVGAEVHSELLKSRGIRCLPPASDQAPPSPSTRAA